MFTLCEHARHRTDSDIAAYCQYHNECGPWLVRDSYEVGSSVVQFRSRGCWPEAEYELVRFSHDSVVGVAVGGSVQEDQAPSATAHVFPGYVRFESTSGGDVLVNLEHGVVAPVLAVPAQEPFGCRGTFECGARQVTCLDEVPWSERVTRRVGDKAFGRKMGAGMMQLMAANERAERGEVFVPLPKDE